MQIHDLILNFENFTEIFKFSTKFKQNFLANVLLDNEYTRSVSSVQWDPLFEGQIAFGANTSNLSSDFIKHKIAKEFEKRKELDLQIRLTKMLCGCCIEEEEPEVTTVQV